MTMTTPRIIQVEDNESFAVFAGALLRAAVGAEVQQYGDGLKGLGACLSGEPDLILLDLELPSLRGEEICRLLRSSRRHSRIPIVVCSSMPEPERREMELLQIGADKYLPKPVDERTLITTVRELLSRSRVSTAALPSSIDLPPVVSTPLEGPAEPIQNEEFAGYRILKILGSGGMGTVYQAQDIDTGQLVALKIMLTKLAGNARLVERFRREAEIMGRLDHPNIVRIFDMSQTRYTFFIAMEYVDGGSLLEKIAGGPIPWQESCRMMRQMFEAVEYLHAQGVIHRDLKPPNILLNSDGVVKIGDFGVSREGTAFENHEFTRAGTVIGTPRYMAPEVLAGAQADHLSDQFALGRTILHMLEGTIAMSFPPQPLHEVRPDLPLPLSRALARCMDVHPTMRFPHLRLARQAVMSSCAMFQE